MVQFWNERYNDSEYAYGKEPNHYFKQKIDSIEVGSILLPAEGEGRNAVYASSKGWDVTAFDSSQVARDKAELLANANNTEINYLVTDVASFKSNIKFDSLAFIFSHFGKTTNNKFYPYLAEFLKVGGYVIFECFSIQQVKYNAQSGGPQDPEMLFTVGDIHQLFPNFEVLDLQERLVQLNEGKYHIGEASVINFYGKKIE